MLARRLAFILGGLALTSSAMAEAHFDLIEPRQVSNDTGGGKGSPPCGPDTGMAATPTPVMGGHPLKLMINETVRHGGFYRFALAIKSRSELPPDNVVYDSGNRVLPPTGIKPAGSDGQSARADVQKPPIFPVIADGVWDHPQDGPKPIMFPSTMYPDEVMLPNVSCDRCVLQVIEFMHPHGFNPSVPGPGGGYFYHHCAELKITPDPGLPIFVPGADGGAPDTATAGDAATDKATTGAAGASGTAGSSGNAGASGTAGASGAAGATGVAGATGTAGATGSGAAGSTASGTAGALGTAGVSATAGAPGSGAAGSGNPRQNSGGCSAAVETSRPPAWIGLLFVSIAIVRRRARQTKP
jgi:hypothetical protein